jgi:purine nucleosidase
MGGAIVGGNPSVYAEFNIFIDPDAVQLVISHAVSRMHMHTMPETSHLNWTTQHDEVITHDIPAIPVTMVPLDMTHTALVTRRVLDAIAEQLMTPLAALVRDLLMFFAKTYRNVFGFESPPLHDPCAVAFLLDPE